MTIDTQEVTDLDETQEATLEGGDWIADLKEAWNSFSEGVYYDYGYRLGYL